ncbi:MAG: T9SS type A sorting domain-containing protein [Bacteroidales bacterium]|jgi:hypothetical protein|nr:T9SS type A sorting domain-containing protein [Bacteroidales bacterium]
MKIKHLRFKFFAISLGAALFLLTTAFIANNFISSKSDKQVNYYQSEHEYLNSLRMNPKTGTVSPTDYAKALKEVQKYRANNANKSSELIWENEGPDNLAGRMRSTLRVESGDKAYWYAGSVSGGLWRLEEGSQVWSIVSESVNSLNVSSMHQSTDGTLYIGTGESFYSEDFNLLPGFKGRGIYKSSNGVDFTVIASTVPTENAVYGEDWFYINKITTINNRLFVGTNTGLNVSDLQGSSWTIAKTSDGQELTGECNELVSMNNAIAAFVDGLAYISVNGDPNNFVCISTKYEESGTIYNSTMLPKNNIGRVCFAFAPSNPDYLYAIAISSDASNRGKLENIYRSVKGNNGWTNWTAIGPGGSTHMFYVFESNGLYSSAIAIDPDNENRIFIGGNDLWRGDYVEGGELYQWTQLTTYKSLYSSAYVPSNHFSYLIDSSGNIAIACENGIYVFNNSTLRASSRNINLTTSQFYTVSANYKGNVYGGTQGNGTVLIDPNTSISGKGGENVVPSISLSTGEDFNAFNIGGYVHNSMINPIGVIVSINGNDDIKDESISIYAYFGGKQRLTIYRYDDQMPQNISYWLDGSDPIKPIEDSASYITPSILWENFNYTQSRDSVDFTADKDYVIGDKVYAASKNAYYPIEVILEENLSEGQTIRVQDIVASKFFVGVNSSIFMTTEASNFNRDFRNDNPWWTISSSKLGGIQGTPQCLGLSKDANYLYVGTKDGKLYKLSNIAAAYNTETANVGSNLYATSGTVTANPYCVVNTSLIADFGDRVITSVSVHPNNSQIVVVTLGNYGFDDYVYITKDALEKEPTFNKVNSLHLAHAPIYTSIFVEGVENNDNMFMIGTDFGIWSTSDITGNQVEWIEEEAGIGELPVFMLKQQNVQTDNGKPVYYDGQELYISNYRGIYAATFGGGVFKCTNLVKTGVTGIDDPVIANNDNDINIYPNPAKDYVNISIETDSNVDATLYIYNVSGKLVNVMTKRSFSDKVTFTLNTSNMQNGTYIAKIDVPNCKSKTSKFIVVK